MSTRRLYWGDEAAAQVCGGLSFFSEILAIQGDAVALAASGFFPGGGGQPADLGELILDGQRLAVTEVEADQAGQIWHRLGTSAGLVPGQRVHGQIDGARRHALSRQHTALHVLNAIAMRDFGAWITGCQVGAETSRIDFKVEAPLAEFAQALIARAGAVIAADLLVSAHWVDESDFSADCVRTLEARPPVIGGRVRVVEIAGFDRQACGGTHASRTGELGSLSLVRTENKGRNNKRLYVRLDRNA